MRLAQPNHVTLADPAAHPLVFTGARGERFQVSVLADDLIRVQMFPDGAPRFHRTWMGSSARMAMRRVRGVGATI